MLGKDQLYHSPAKKILMMAHGSEKEKSYHRMTHKALLGWACAETPLLLPPLPQKYLWTLPSKLGFAPCVSFLFGLTLHWIFIFPSKLPLHLTVYICIQMAQRLKRLPAMQDTWVQSLGQEDPLEKEMATHFSILAWRIPWMEEPSRLQSKRSQRVRHNWATSLS